MERQLDKEVLFEKLETTPLDGDSDIVDNGVQAVEDIFSALDITDYIEKSNLLLEFQGGISFSSSEYKKLIPIEIYRNELGVFLSGAWRRARGYTDSKKDVVKRAQRI